MKILQSPWASSSANSFHDRAIALLWIYVGYIILIVSMQISLCQNYFCMSFTKNGMSYSILLEPSNTLGTMRRAGIMCGI